MGNCVNVVGNGSDKFVVFTFWGEVLVMLVGVDDCDEVTLSYLLDILGEYFRDHIGKKPLQELTEQHLIQSDQYDKMCMGIDEMISSTVSSVLGLDYSKFSRRCKRKEINSTGGGIG